MLEGVPKQELQNDFVALVCLMQSLWEGEGTVLANQVFYLIRRWNSCLLQVQALSVKHIFGRFHSNYLVSLLGHNPLVAKNKD